MADQLRVAVNGAAGRMGQRVTSLVHQTDDLVLAAAIEAEGSPAIGRDIGELAGIGVTGVIVSPELVDGVDVVIDFSTPAGLTKIAAVCGERQIPLVAATTGLTTDQVKRVQSAAHNTPMVMAPSMSLGVNIAMKLVQRAAQAMTGIPNGVDVEILERHHRFKEDAPSGTALHFGKLVAEIMGQTNHVHGRSGRVGMRTADEIGYHAIRTGDNVGEHTIVFGMLGETLELTVRSHTRDAYAYGALAAARFVVTQGAGVYGMFDVLGLND